MTESKRILDRAGNPTAQRPLPLHGNAQRAADGLPPAVLQRLWEEGIEYVMEALLNGYSKIKKVRCGCRVSRPHFVALVHHRRTRPHVTGLERVAGWCGAEGR